VLFGGKKRQRHGWTLIGVARLCKNLTELFQVQHCLSQRGLQDILKGSRLSYTLQGTARQTKKGGGSGARLYGPHGVAALLENLNISRPGQVPFQAGDIAQLLQEYLNCPGSVPEVNSQISQNSQVSVKKQTGRPASRSKKKGVSRKSAAELEKEYTSAVARSCSHAGAGATALVMAISTTPGAAQAVMHRRRGQKAARHKSWKTVVRNELRLSHVQFLECRKEVRDVIRKSARSGLLSCKIKTDGTPSDIISGGHRKHIKLQMTSLHLKCWRLVGAVRILSLPLCQVQNTGGTSSPCAGHTGGD
jgi:hypothetical protein